MLQDYPNFDLVQLFEDMTDYLVLIDGVLEEMEHSDPDYKRAVALEGHIEGILEVIDELWENNGNTFYPAE